MRLYVLLTLLVSTSATAQSDRDPFQSGTDSLYAAALTACLTAQVKAYGNTSPRYSDTMEVAVERVDGTAGMLPNRIGAHPIRHLDANALQRLAAKPRGTELIRPFPIRLSSTTLRLSFNNYVVRTSRGGGLNYALWGGCRAEFRPSSSSGAFEPVATELWGV